MQGQAKALRGLVVGLVALAAMAPVTGVGAHEKTAVTTVAKGLASWYGDAHHGRRTASGEIYDQQALTAAHPTLPFGTIVRVTNLRNGKSVDVRVNDRGPVVRGRIIDLSRAAARAIGSVGRGIVPVKLAVLPAAPKVVATPVGAGN